MSEEQNKVWGVFVGVGGYQLKAFNSQTGPFPPKPNGEGYIAIGWPAVGDMRLYENKYSDFLEKFSKVYPKDNTSQANAAWNFAFEMKKDHWVICPSSATGYLLIGKIISDYIPDFYNEYGFHKLTDEAFLHLRKVQWLYVMTYSNARELEINKIGMLTVSESRFSIQDLKAKLGPVNPI